MVVRAAVFGHASSLSLLSASECPWLECDGENAFDGIVSLGPEIRWERAGERED